MPRCGARFTKRNHPQGGPPAGRASLCLFARKSRFSARTHGASGFTPLPIAHCFRLLDRRPLRRCCGRVASRSTASRRAGNRPSRTFVRRRRAEPWEWPPRYRYIEFYPSRLTVVTSFHVTFSAAAQPEGGDVSQPNALGRRRLSTGPAASPTWIHPTARAVDQEADRPVMRHGPAVSQATSGTLRAPINRDQPDKRPRRDRSHTHSSGMTPKRKPGTRQGRLYCRAN